MARSFTHWEAPLGVVAFFGFLAFLAFSREEPSKYEFKPTFADVSYGPAQQQKLDFYQARTDRPAPLVAYFHGGAFVSGDKTDCHAGLVNVLNGSGIHFATINYRYANGKDLLFPKPQRDGARAVQFLRMKAREWNIAPERIACFGESAGAGISLWIGFHDDLADPDNPDPVLRESSRIAAVGDLEGQATYDPIKIRKLIGGRAWEHPSLYKNFGVGSAEEALHKMIGRTTVAEKALPGKSEAKNWRFDTQRMWGDSSVARSPQDIQYSHLEQGEPSAANG